MSEGLVDVLLLGGPCAGVRITAEQDWLRRNMALAMPYVENPDAAPLERSYAQAVYRLRPVSADANEQRYGVSWVGVW